MSTWGNTYWPIFLGVSFLAFLGPEIYSLVSVGGANTLSQWVWTQLKITSNERMVQWSALDFLMFGQWITAVVWLTYHFFFHRFT